MKLDQEQIKKLGLAVVVLIAVLYGYFAYLLGPLKQGELNATRGIATVTPQIADAKVQIAERESEKVAPDATAFLAQLKDTIPDGAPIAWFPPKMANFFKRHGIEKSTTHMVSDSGEVMPGLQEADLVG